MKKNLLGSGLGLVAASLIIFSLFGAPALALFAAIIVIYMIASWGSEWNNQLYICSFIAPFVLRDPASEGGGGAATETEEKLLNKIKENVGKQLENRATKEELLKLKEDIEKTYKDFPLDALRSMADPKNGAMAAIANQGLLIQQLQTQLENTGKREDMSTRAQVAKWMEENKDAIASIKNGTKADLKPLQIRAVSSPMTVATVNAAGSPYIGRVEHEAGVNLYPRYALTFWDFLTKGRTSAETYTWVNMVFEDGAAEWLAPGALKPGISFKMEADKSNAKKIADSAKAATELLQDIDGMVSFIEEELRYKVMEKLNATLMSSVGTSTVPTGVRQLSTTYTLTGISVYNPTTADVIRSIVAQLRSGKLTGEITVFINSIDSANMDMEKAGPNGVYLLPPFVTADGKTIGGARIIEDPNIPVGFVQAGFMRYYRILLYQDFQATWGWVNDDFTRNLVTAVGEMRLHQFFNAMYTGAFVYDQISSVATAIAKT